MTCVRRGATLGGFFRALREAMGGKAFPPVWVPEWQKTHGLHVHYAGGRGVPRSVIGQAWNHGWSTSDCWAACRWVRVRLRMREWLRGYLSKYVDKSFNDDNDEVRRSKGLHRIDVAQGFRHGGTLVNSGKPTLVHGRDVGCAA